MKVHWHHHFSRIDLYSNVSQRVANLNGSQQTVHWTSFVYSTTKSAVSLEEHWNPIARRVRSLLHVFVWNKITSSRRSPRMTHLFPHATNVLCENITKPRDSSACSVLNSQSFCKFAPCEHCRMPNIFVVVCACVAKKIL